VAEWWIAAAVVAAACAVIGIVSQPTVKKPAPAIVGQHLEHAESLFHPAQAKAPVPHRRRHVRRTRLPRLDVFPTPAPVPEAEIALARLAVANPEIAKALLAEPETGEPDPIVIEPISIKPLDEE
jgi:hypothetical protein